jgi:hypothetical protein
MHPNVPTCKRGSFVNHVHVGTRASTLDFECAGKVVFSRSLI